MISFIDNFKFKTDNLKVFNRMSEISGKTVVVDLGDRSYPIMISHNTYSDIGQWFTKYCGPKKAIIITDDNVNPLYSRNVVEGLQATGITTHIISVAPGENAKSLSILSTIYDALFDCKAERSDAVVALGGGVIGDLAGYAAASFKRGLKYVQVPTTLLAMVDSAVGGKTGINHSRGKNMIGAFHQPDLVYSDIHTLNTLPKRERSCGMAETIKHAIIQDSKFFTHLENNIDAINHLEQQLMINLVERNCQIKANVVAQDEKEHGVRGYLNFGHTIGHTFETVMKANGFHHGEAIALGMVAELRMAVKRNMFTQGDLEKVVAMFVAYGLPVSLDEIFPTDALYEAMKQDKKVSGGKIKFAIPTQIGQCTFVNDFTESEIKWAINTLAK
jgi:3-dehydroquinate synthase